MAITPEMMYVLRVLDCHSGTAILKRILIGGRNLNNPQTAFCSKTDRFCERMILRIIT
jgi:hypothetical protein